MAGRYQGHRNWNHWNVALTLFNDFGAYEMMSERVDANPGDRDQAARDILEELPDKTPDGAPYTYTSVRAALEKWEA